MRKLAVLFMLVIASALVFSGAIPLYAQQSTSPTQPAAPSVVASDLFSRASASLSAQDYNKAVLDLSLFILLNPTFSPAYFGRAQGYMGLNDFDHALQDVNHALDTSGTNTADYNAALYALRGEIDRQQQKPDAALSDYTQSITLKPTVQALANRGMLYMSQNNLHSALTDFDSALNLDSTNPVLYVYRGLINSQSQDVQAAGADYLNFFNLIQTNTINHAELQTGQVVTLQVDRGVVYHLPFQAKAKQYVSALAVARSGNVDPLMVLLDPQGNPLAGDDDSGGNSNALLLNYQVLADGQYTLVLGHSLGGFTGAVLVQFQVSDQPAQ